MGSPRPAAGRPVDPPRPGRAAEEAAALRRARDPSVAGFCLFGGEAEGVARLTATAARRGGPAAALRRERHGARRGAAGEGACACCPTPGSSGSAGIARRGARLRPADRARRALGGGGRALRARRGRAQRARATRSSATAAFGYDPDRVARSRRPTSRARSRAGALPTAKHYPGHGGTLADSHDAVPVVAEPARVIEDRDLAPFLRVLDAGCPAVMTAHVAYPSLDASGAIATFSRVIVDRLFVRARARRTGRRRLHGRAPHGRRARRPGARPTPRDARSAPGCHAHADPDAIRSGSRRSCSTAPIERCARRRRRGRGARDVSARRREGRGRRTRVPRRGGRRRAGAGRRARRRLGGRRVAQAPARRRAHRRRSTTTRRPIAGTCSRGGRGREGVDATIVRLGRGVDLAAARGRDARRRDRRDVVGARLEGRRRRLAGAGRRRCARCARTRRRRPTSCGCLRARARTASTCRAPVPTSSPRSPTASSPAPDRGGAPRASTPARSRAAAGRRGAARRPAARSGTSTANQFA